jgi:hypothetical protein
VGVDTVVIGDDTTDCTNPKEDVFPTNVFGGADTFSDIAHLVPVSATNAGMYGDVARCVFALSDDTDGDNIQQYIHGYQNKGENSSEVNQHDQAETTTLHGYEASYVEHDGRNNFLTRSHVFLLSLSWTWKK